MIMWNKSNVWSCNFWKVSAVNENREGVIINHKFRTKWVVLKPKKLGDGYTKEQIMIWY